MDAVAGLDAIESVVALAISASPPPGMSCKVVAIDGPGGAGKSTLAARTGRLLDAPVIHTDDFASWENPTNWWPRLLEQVLVPLSRGQPARYQRYDWDIQQLTEWREVLAGDYLVIEGVTAIRSEFRPYLTVKVWVSTPRDECLRRGLERDGQDAEAAWREWQVAEDAYVAQDHPELAADLIVGGTDGQLWTGPGRPDKSQEP